jgi:hypothetical protein
MAAADAGCELAYSLPPGPAPDDPFEQPNGRALRTIMRPMWIPQNNHQGTANTDGQRDSSSPIDWGKLMIESLFSGGSEPGAAMNATEVTDAAKQIGRAYLDAHERAALITIELRERFAAATGADWLMAMAGTQAELERDATNMCFSVARELLG